MTTFYIDYEQGTDGTRDDAALTRGIYYNGTTYPTIDTTRIKYGNYSLNMVGASSNAAINTVNDPNGGFQFGAGQFTVETWVWFQTHSATAWEEILGQWASSSNLGWTLGISNVENFQFKYSTTGTNTLTVGAAYTPPTGQWLHLAADRDASNVLRVYANGTMVASATVSSTLFSSTRTLYMGNNGNLNAPFPGQIGGIHISKGVARYATGSGFTPPASAFVPDAYSVMCLNFTSNGDGKSFGNRRRTLQNVGPVEGLAAGDVLRVMAAPDPTLLGNATWTKLSRTVTLASAVTANIWDCGTAFPYFSTNASSLTTTGSKEGSLSAGVRFASGFTTGAACRKTLHCAGGSVASGAHRYWRIYVTAANGSTYTAICEVELRASAGGADETGSGTAASSSNYPTLTPDKAFDNSTVQANGWASNGGFPCWLSYDFGAGVTKEIVEVAIHFNVSGFLDQSPTAWSLQYSDDNSAWTTAFDVSSLWTVNNTQQVFTRVNGYDFSAYQQVSFSMYNTVALAAGCLSLQLCSDFAGTTPVHTIAIPATPTANQWQKITVDTGAALNSAVASIVVYANTDPGTPDVYFDNILACKASSSADALTLTSLIGKVHNLSWVASTAYALNDKRIPTQPNRNGFVYKVTTAGTTSGTEPTWPLDVGLSVTDGSVVWQCVDLEDTWYGIKSINGTTVLLDQGHNSSASAGRGYSETTETVATYRRETIRPASQNGGTFDFLQWFNGTGNAPITVSGGWDRTNMSVQSGQTWVDGRNGTPLMLGIDGKSHVVIENMNYVFASIGIRNNNGDTVNVTARNCHCNHMASFGFYWYYSTFRCRMIGCSANCNESVGIVGEDPMEIEFWRVTSRGNASYGTHHNDFGIRLRGNYYYAKNNVGWGLVMNNAGAACNLGNFVTENNSSGGFQVPGFGGGPHFYFYNALINESTKYGGFTNYEGTVIYSERHQQVAGASFQQFERGTIQSTTAQRDGATGRAWVFNPTSTICTSAYPLYLLLDGVGVAGGSAVSVTIRCRRDNTNIVGKLVLEGGTVPGVGDDVVVTCAPSINTWTTSSTLTFTPTEDCAVTLKFLVYDGVNTNNSFWIDNISVTQA